MRKKLSFFLGSIAFKIGIVFALMVSLTGIAIYTGSSVFETVSREMADLDSKKIPKLYDAEEINLQADQLKEAIIKMTAANDQDTLRSMADQARAHVQELGQKLRNLGAGHDALATTVDTDIDEIFTARSTVFTLSQDLRGSVTELSGIDQKVNVQLNQLIDDAYFDAYIGTEALDSASTVENGYAMAPQSTAIRPETRAAPLTEHLDRYRYRWEFLTALQNFMSATHDTSIARDEAELAIARDQLTSAFKTLERASAKESSILGPELDQLRKHSAPDTGLVAKRLAILTQERAVQDLSQRINTDVAQITSVAAMASHEILENIANSADSLVRNSHAATRTMDILALSSAAVVLLATIMVWLMIVRPMRQVARATRYLAEGQINAIDGLHGRGGEIAQMVEALHIFRDGITERARLEEEGRRNRQRQEADEKARLEAERERERAQEQREREAEQRQREQEQAEQAEREQMRQAAEAERKAHAEAQNAVVQALAGGLKDLASGDLRTQITQPFGEGYEQLRVDFNAAVRTLAQALNEINESADTIFSGSSNITHAAEDLSRRTERTAATLEETAAALQQLTAAVDSAAKGAEEADHTVDETRHCANDGDQVVRNAITAMGGISKSSNKISRIIDVIDDIAFQTNLLALNAGVEAARAGEAGRGFAVVASEVRALSQRSSEAAREIGELIAESSRQVGAGVELVNEVGEALSKIVASITNISSNVSAIAASAREQSAGIAEINTAVGQLDHTTQQNAGMVEETTAACTDLTREAQTLIKILQRFTLEQGELDTPPMPQVVNG